MLAKSRAGFGLAREGACGKPKARPGPTILRVRSDATAVERADDTARSRAQADRLRHRGAGGLHDPGHHLEATIFESAASLPTRLRKLTSTNEAGLMLRLKVLPSLKKTLME
jgi:hypothetical protein